MKVFFAIKNSGILLGKKKLLWRQVWNLEVEYLKNLPLTNPMGSRQKIL